MKIAHVHIHVYAYYAACLFLFKGQVHKLKLTIVIVRDVCIADVSFLWHADNCYEEVQLN